MPNRGGCRNDIFLHNSDSRARALARTDAFINLSADLSIWPAQTRVASVATCWLRMAVCSAFLRKILREILRKFVRSSVRSSVRSTVRSFIYSFAKDAFGRATRPDRCRSRLLPESRKSSPRLSRRHTRFNESRKRQKRS